MRALARATGWRLASASHRGSVARTTRRGTMRRGAASRGVGAFNEDGGDDFIDAAADDDDFDDDEAVMSTSTSGVLSRWTEALARRDGDDAEERLESGLYLVGTPIGNLEDVTLRALRVLRGADAVLAEDTRRTRRLLSAYGISTQLVSYHAHNEAKRRESALRRLTSGAALALVSDAGMPTVNDPGRDLAMHASIAGVRVVPVPGPSAVLAALAGAGLPTEEFTFIGFPPPKSSARVKRFKSFATLKTTLIMFVPPHKLLGTLEDAAAALGDRRCAVCRELTKVHEEFWRSTLTEAREEFERRAPKGEITLVIEGYSGDINLNAGAGDDADEGVEVSSVEDAVRALLIEGVSPSEASRRVAKELGVRRRETYGVAQRLSETLKR